MAHVWFAIRYAFLARCSSGRALALYAGISNEELITKFVQEAKNLPLHHSQNALFVDHFLHVQQGYNVTHFPRSRCIMHLVSSITINSRAAMVAGSPAAKQRDTIPAHCTAPQQYVPDGIFAK
jgi:hypothetical protein